MTSAAMLTYTSLPPSIPGHSTIYLFAASLFRNTMSDISPSEREGDETWPIFLADNVPSKSDILSWIMRFNAVLDANMLNGFLYRASNRGDGGNVAQD
jgi:hypothetical protein